MKITFVVALLWLTSGCSTLNHNNENFKKLNHKQIRLKTKNIELKWSAIQVLQNNGVHFIENTQETLPLLSLSEQVAEKINSVDANGNIDSYQINYQLTYQINDDAPAQTLSRNIVISHDDDRYRSSTQQRKNRIESVRLSLLQRVAQILILSKQWSSLQP